MRDAAHHMHPFTAQSELGEKGARVITRANGVFVYDSEGEEIPNGTNGSADRAEAPKEIITAIARRVLPALRQYSTWLASSASFLMAVSAPQTSDITMTTRIIKHAWATLNLGSLVSAAN